VDYKLSMSVKTLSIQCVDSHVQNTCRNEIDTSWIRSLLLLRFFFLDLVKSYNQISRLSYQLSFLNEVTNNNNLYLFLHKAYNNLLFYQSSSSSAHYRPLLDIGLSIFSPSRSIFGYSYPAPASHPAQVVTPPGLRASYSTFTETGSPL
jgi:hypothetical protein